MDSIQQYYVVYLLSKEVQYSIISVNMTVPHWLRFSKCAIFSDLWLLKIFLIHDSLLNDLIKSWLLGSTLSIRIEFKFS